MPSPSHLPELGQLLDRELVALARGVGDDRAVDPVDVAAGEVQQGPGQERSGVGGLARVADQGGTAGVLLEAAVVAAAAQPPAGYDAQVADLGADPEGAAVELAVEHQPAPDAGADGHQQQVVDVVPGAVGELAPRRGVGVVLDHHREVDPRLQLGLEVDVAPGEVRARTTRSSGTCRRSRRRRPRPPRGRGWRPAARPVRRWRPRSPRRPAPATPPAGARGRCRRCRRRRRRSWCRRRRSRTRGSSVLLRPRVVVRRPGRCARRRRRGPRRRGARRAPRWPGSRPRPA